jgi:hypothetical protein
LWKKNVKGCALIEGGKMVSSTTDDCGVVTMGQTLARYATDSADLIVILDSVHPESQINRVSLEYEIKMLKIVSVGWGLSFFGAENPEKEALTTAYWTAINIFSRDLSATVSAVVDKKIDYFNILKERTDFYVSALGRNSEAKDPVTVIGPKFAECCGDRDNVHIVMAGNRAFSYTLKAVRDYLLCK